MAEHGDTCFPSLPFVLIGEAEDDYQQLLTLNLVDGCLYHLTGNVPSNARCGSVFEFIERYGKLLKDQYM